MRAKRRTDFRISILFTQRTTGHNHASDLHLRRTMPPVGEMSRRLLFHDVSPMLHSFFHHVGEYR